METLRALAALCEPPGDERHELGRLLGLGAAPPESEWSELFVFQLVPYASIYLGDEGRIGGEARDRVAGFWRALDLEPPNECDHLAVMLAFQAELGGRAAASDGEERDRWRHVGGAFLHEHLLSWLPVYLLKVENLAAPFYRRWGELLASALAAEAERLPAPASAPLHWRRAPELADPRAAGGEAFLRSLLTPLASGLVLTRADLERAAGELELGLRIGERRFLLETLLSQAPAPVLGWLGGESRAWRRRLQAKTPPGLPAGAIWRQRAAASAELLDELAAEAG